MSSPVMLEIRPVGAPPSPSSQWPSAVSGPPPFSMGTKVADLLPRDRVSHGRTRGIVEPIRLPERADSDDVAHFMEDDILKKERVVAEV